MKSSSLSNIHAKLGLFDSGIGGVTVFREIKRLMPKVSIAYLGDTARVPYGIRSGDTIIRYATQCADFLVQQGVEILVIACNTSSAHAIDVLMKRYDVPVIGVVIPGARAAVKATTSKKIGVIGTQATIASGAYSAAIKSFDQDVKVTGIPCPLFVPLVEEGWIDNEVASLTAKTYMKSLMDEEPDIDTIVLGCTHYPILKPLLAKESKEVFGRDIKLIDSALETALDVKEKILENGNNSSSEATKNHYVFYTTDDPEKFIQVGSSFLGEEIPGAEMVKIPPETEKE